MVPQATVRSLIVKNQSLFLRQFGPLCPEIVHITPSGRWLLVHKRHVCVRPSKSCIPRSAGAGDHSKLQHSKPHKSGHSSREMRCDMSIGRIEGKQAHDSVPCPGGLVSGASANDFSTIVPTSAHTCQVAVRILVQRMSRMAHCEFGRCPLGASALIQLRTRPARNFFQTFLIVRANFLRAYRRGPDSAVGDCTQGTTIAAAVFL
jgi:hypothetical protein